MNSPTRFKPAVVPTKKEENITAPIAESVTAKIINTITDEPSTEELFDESKDPAIDESKDPAIDESKYPPIPVLNLASVSSRLKKLEKIINKGELPIGHIALRCLNCGKNLVAARTILRNGLMVVEEATMISLQPGWSAPSIGERPFCTDCNGPVDLCL